MDYTGKSKPARQVYTGSMPSKPSRETMPRQLPQRTAKPLDRPMSKSMPLQNQPKGGVMPKSLSRQSVIPKQMGTPKRGVIPAGMKYKANLGTRNTPLNKASASAGAGSVASFTDSPRLKRTNMGVRAARGIMPKGPTGGYVGQSQK